MDMNMVVDTQSARQFNRAMFRASGGVGVPESEVQDRALGLAARYARKGILIIKYTVSEARQLMFLTVAVAVGSRIITSPMLDELALGLGAVTAARFLAQCTRYRRSDGQNIGLSITDEQNALAVEGDSALCGTWGNAPGRYH
jgi:hypothetical protein